MSSRSSHPEVFLRKAVLKVCSKLTGEHPCQSVEARSTLEVLIRKKLKLITLNPCFILITTCVITAVC